MIRYTPQILICQDDAYMYRSLGRSVPMATTRTSHQYFRSAGADSISGSGCRASRSTRPPARVFTHISPRNRLDPEYFTRNSITVKLLPFHVRTLSESSRRNPHFCFLVPYKKYKEIFLPSLISDNLHTGIHSLTP